MSESYVHPYVFLAMHRQAVRGQTCGMTLQQLLAMGRDYPVQQLGLLFPVRPLLVRSDGVDADTAMCQLASWLSERAAHFLYTIYTELLPPMEIWLDLSDAYTLMYHYLLCLLPAWTVDGLNVPFAALVEQAYEQEQCPAALPVFLDTIVPIPDFDNAVSWADAHPMLPPYFGLSLLAAVCVLTGVLDDPVED